MARPPKQTVDYFPHDAVPGKTLFILQSRFGNNGYAGWFKILALLCRTPGHAYDYNSTPNWQYLIAELGLSGGETLTLLSCLAELFAIDPELYLQKIIWSQNLVNRLQVVYRERKTSLPIKPPINPDPCEVSPPINPNPCELLVLGTLQTKVKETKGNETKVDDPPTPLPLARLSPTTSEDNDNEVSLVFRGYETEIGLLTPLIGEKIKDALTIFPASWITETFSLASAANKRSWNYCEAILKRWKAEGKDDGHKGKRKQPAAADLGEWDRAEKVP